MIKFRASGTRKLVGAFETGRLARLTATKDAKIEAWAAVNDLLYVLLADAQIVPVESRRANA